MVIGGFNKMVIGSSFRATLSKSDQVRPFDFQAMQGTSTEQLLTAPALLKSDQVRPFDFQKMKWTSTEQFLPRRFAELGSGGVVIRSNYPPLSDSDRGRSSF